MVHSAGGGRGFTELLDETGLTAQRGEGAFQTESQQRHGKELTAE